eukprot:5268725-Prymnesium_polylepis.2
MGPSTCDANLTDSFCAVAVASGWKLTNISGGSDSAPAPSCAMALYLSASCARYPIMRSACKAQRHFW